MIIGYLFKNSSVMVIWADWNTCISTGMWDCNWIFVKGIWLRVTTDRWLSRRITCCSFIAHNSERSYSFSLFKVLPYGFYLMRFFKEKTFILAAACVWLSW